MTETAPRDPWLLTPGPLTTAESTRLAMLHVTVRTPADPRFHFEVFYQALQQRGYVIYPGKLTVANSFRVGTIGRLGEKEMRGALGAMRAALEDMGVEQRAPAPAHLAAGTRVVAGSPR